MKCHFIWCIVLHPKWHLNQWSESILLTRLLSVNSPCFRLAFLGLLSTAKEMVFWIAVLVILIFEQKIWRMFRPKHQVKGNNQLPFSFTFLSHLFSRCKDIKNSLKGKRKDRIQAVQNTEVHTLKGKHLSICLLLSFKSVGLKNAFLWLYESSILLKVCIQLRVFYPMFPKLEEPYIRRWKPKKETHQIPTENSNQQRYMVFNSQRSFKISFSVKE